jgi:hypothetical protein
VAGEQALSPKQAIDLIRQAVGKRPEIEKDRPPADGALGAMNGRLTKLLGSDAGRKSFIKAAFGKDSSKALCEAQVSAVLGVSDAMIKAATASGEPVGKQETPWPVRDG